MASNLKFVNIPANIKTNRYLDYAATSPLLPEVKEAMCQVFTAEIGNASSLHSFGQRARRLLEDARINIAKIINAEPEEIVFTSGGTEANNTVMHIFAGQNIAVSAIEHPSVLKSAEYYAKKCEILAVDSVGRADLTNISEDIDLISVMLANNEVGTIQPIAEFVQLSKKHAKNKAKMHVKFTTPSVENCHNDVVKNTTVQSKNTKNGVVKITTDKQDDFLKNVVKNTTKPHETYFHSDATQALGKIPIDVKALGVDYLTISAHKIGGPVGIGALYVRQGAPFKPLMLGGHQEEGRRAGTSNVAAAVGFGVAAKLALERQIWHIYNTRVGELRNQLAARITRAIPDVVVNTPEVACLPHILNVSFSAAEGESIQLYLDLAGVMVSTGSACAAGDLAPSPVMMALHHDAELAHGSVRFSLGLETTSVDIDYIMQILPDIVNKLRGISTIK